MRKFNKGPKSSSNYAQKERRDYVQDMVDEKFNISHVKDGNTRIAYLCNIKEAQVIDEDQIERSAILFYFVQQNGEFFKSYLKFEPYFFIQVQEDYTKEVISYLEKKFENRISSISIVEKIDLDMINHLSGKMAQYLKLSFKTIQEMNQVKNQIKPRIERNKAKENDIYAIKKISDLLDTLIDIREYDVQYHSRVCIDRDIRMSLWYKVSFKQGYIDQVIHLKDMVDRPDLRVLAFDIETTKLPLKFPDSNIDIVMQISITVDGDTILINNRQVLTADVEDFEYTPKPEYESHVHVFNEQNELNLLNRFFQIVIDTKPFIITTFNGDFFDWPFIDQRCNKLGISLEEAIGIYQEDSIYFGRFMTHLDCYCWVDRDSYLPQGSHGLKAVTKAKLKYDPVEVDPELMVPLARSDPQKMSEYSISDAVATYYLYKKHIHDFIFALGTIIPMNSDEVLRKGSGTLCEALLMAAAFKGNIVFPNKKREQSEKFYQGHLLELETYTGGKVACINSGVYRSDIQTRFKLEPSAFKQLATRVVDTIDFAVKIELGLDPNDVVNKDEVAQQIIEKLDYLKDLPNYQSYDETPLIYHVDVAAMYPNIILTNRLQPVAIVDDKQCSGCLYNVPESNCKRPLEWEWRGDYYPLNRNEYEKIKFQLEYETKDDELSKNDDKKEENESLLKQRVKLYCQKQYKKQKETKTLLKQNVVCMRENSFYVDTVRSFRDRRYQYKNLVKVWKNKESEAKGQAQVQEAKDRQTLYESLQLAHKVILNSFYGYVMRKGARWYSMEMAAMVTHQGSSIISDAFHLITKVGKVLELDTDGIWCLLPKQFPEQFNIKMKNGKIIKFDYPCSMCNILVYEKYMNRQYQVVNDDGSYQTSTEMSIFFEIDGPYRAMIIPAAREEGKLLKKRYAVYQPSGQLAELKGFELKRRGELKIIKIFQTQIFSEFLKGNTLDECYQAVGKVAERWLNILYNKGDGIEDDELIDYIGENRVMSKSLKEYGLQKGVSLTCARRMAEFLGDELVKGKGLNCSFIIANKPIESPIADRVIPLQIFDVEEVFNLNLEYQKQIFKKMVEGQQCFKCNNQIHFRLGLLHTKYFNLKQYLLIYIGLGNTIQKIITIPAALQKCTNPVPSLDLPDWVLQYNNKLQKRVKEMDSKFQQQNIGTYFQKQEKQVIQNYPKQIKQTPIKQIIQQQEEEIDNPYNMKTDYQDWLKFQKKSWVKGLKNQESSNQKVNQKQGLKKLFIQKDQEILNQVWNILMVHETETKGQFKVWIQLESQQIISIKVVIPRVIYINSYVKNELNDSTKIAKKKLPREKQAKYLYEVKMNEQDFQNTYNNFDYFLTNPDIEGLYETKLPLDFKFIVNIGCTIKLQKQIIQKIIQSGGYSAFQFQMEDLYPLFSHEKPYLDDFQIPLTLISQLQFKDKYIWAYFNPIQHEVEFIFIQKQQELSIKQEIQKILNNLQLQYKINISQQISNDLAIQYLEKVIQKGNLKNQSIIVVQSEFNINKLQSFGLKSLGTDIPCMFQPQLDTNILNSSLFDWKQKGVKFVTEFYNQLDQQIQEQLQLCRYASIPLCNLPKDKVIYAMDLFYSRLLKSSNCLSWYNEGNNFDDYRTLIPTDLMPNQICKQNLYNEYCVEVDIGFMALNSILASDDLKNIDKDTSKMIENEENQIDYCDEQQTSKTAFKLLKTLAKGWFDDVYNNNSIYGDKMIENLHHWIYNDKSRLYDPILGKMLNILMKKIFQYLLGKLKNLGANIVYATRNKIIFSTNKDTQVTAENYSLFILQSVVSYPIFSYLNLNPTRYWKLLLFKNQYNYSGIDDQDNILIEMEIKNYLPSKIQKFFQGFIVEYLINLKNFKNDNLQQLKLEQLIQEYSIKLIKTTLTNKFLNLIPELQKNYRESKRIYELNLKKIEQLNDDVQNEQIEDEESENDYVNFLIFQDEQEFLNRKQQLKKRLEEFKEWQFPENYGVRINYQNSVLELINFLSHILSIDKNIEQEVISLRKILLRTIQISEYSDLAKFQEPSYSLIIQDLICNQCCIVCDIDIFRNNFLSNDGIICQNCNNYIDPIYFEYKLIKYLKDSLILYQICIVLNVE